VPTSANTVVFRLLLAVVLLAPLPLGSNRPWAWSLLAVLIGALLAAWAVLVLAGRGRASMPLGRMTAVAVPFGLVLAWAFVQASGAVPASWWHPLWGDAAAALGRPPSGAISVNPELTRTAILRLASYGGIFWLAAQLGRERSRAREALVAVAMAGVAYATYGLIVHFAGWERILWLEKWAYPGDLTATFVGRNAYGAYAGLGALCCIALFVHALRPPRAGEERRAFDMAEIVLVRALPFLAGALVLGSALLLSHSRGAFLCTGAALVVLMLTLVVGRVTPPRTALLLGGAVLGIGLAVLAVSGDETIRRLAETGAAHVEEARPDLYRLTAVAIADAPWTGHGYGAFLPAFRMYRDTSLTTPVMWDYAHDVHLEIAMDLGLPATVLLYVALAVILGGCVRGLLRRRRDQIYPAVAITAATLLGTHGIVDFSVQMPAIAATLALLLGIGYAHSWRSAEMGMGRDATTTEQGG
jgi:O-antigen ligase